MPHHHHHNGGFGGHGNFVGALEAGAGGLALGDALGHNHGPLVSLAEGAAGAYMLASGGLSVANNLTGHHWGQRHHHHY